MTEDKYEVGNSITDGEGVEWVITRKWVHYEGIDLDLIHKISREHGFLRVKNI